MEQRDILENGASDRGKARKVTQCSVCGQTGHTKPRCPSKTAVQNVTSSSSVPLEHRVSARKRSKVRHEEFQYSESDSDDEGVTLEDFKKSLVFIEDDPDTVKVADRVIVDLTTLKWTPEEDTPSNSDNIIPTFDFDIAPGSLYVAPLGQGERNVDFSVGKAWSLYFTDDIINNFVINTNSYASQNRSVKWRRDVDAHELKQFFAILYIFGVNDTPSMRNAWDKDPLSLLAIPLVQKIMKRHRFEAILANWHWLDSSKYDNANIQRRNADDGFWTVTSLVDKISIISKDYWQLGQDFAIDEQCIPMKGRHRCRCFNAKKPYKFHFKMFSLNDSNTGYQYQFFLYRGKDENRPEDMSATLYPVHVLTKDVRLHHKGHICNVDN